MKKLIIYTVILALVLPLTASAENLVRSYGDGEYTNGPEVDVWVDNDDGIYYEGETIRIFFQASQDCYVAIYSIDTRGDVNLIFPAERYESGRIQGGELYAIPSDYEDYDLVVTGPEGIEHIVAVASDKPIDIPNWYNGAPINCDYNDDREDFIDYINDRYFTCSQSGCDRVFDQEAIYIKVPEYYYKPVYVPDSWYSYPNYSLVYIDYPYGGEIYIDGIFFGIAPLYIPRVYWGWHWFTIYDRYGYCWESHIQVNNINEIYIDRSRVKTTPQTVSRYKDIRAQAKKYSPSTYVKSDRKVKSSRSSAFENSRDKYSRGSSGSIDSRYDKSSSGKSSTATRSYPSTKKSTGTYDRRSTSSSRVTSSTGSVSSGRSSKVSKSTGSKTVTRGKAVTKKSTPAAKSTPSTKSTPSSKGAVQKSSPAPSNNGNSGASKSSSSPRSSGGSKRSSGGGR